MVLQMSRPTKHAKTGVYYFRQKTPADLVAIVGKKEVGWSLGTKDPEQAKVLNTLAVQRQAMILERYRKRPGPLPLAKIVALSGILYRDYMAMLELEPGEPSLWETQLVLLDKAAARPEGREKWYGPEADRLLLEQGIVTDEASRGRLSMPSRKLLVHAGHPDAPVQPVAARCDLLDRPQWAATVQLAFARVLSATTKCAIWSAWALRKAGRSVMRLM